MLYLHASGYMHIQYVLLHLISDSTSRQLCSIYILTVVHSCIIMDYLYSYLSMCIHTNYTLSLSLAHMGLYFATD